MGSGRPSEWKPPGAWRRVGSLLDVYSSRCAGSKLEWTVTIISTIYIQFMCTVHCTQQKCICDSELKAPAVPETEQKFDVTNQPLSWVLHVATVARMNVESQTMTVTRASTSRGIPSGEPQWLQSDGIYHVSYLVLGVHSRRLMRVHFVN